MAPADELAADDEGLLPEPPARMMPLMNCPSYQAAAR